MSQTPNVDEMMAELTLRAGALVGPASQVPSEFKDALFSLFLMGVRDCAAKIAEQPKADAHFDAVVLGIEASIVLDQVQRKIKRDIEARDKKDEAA